VLNLGKGGVGTAYHATTALAKGSGASKTLGIVGGGLGMLTGAADIISGFRRFRKSGKRRGEVETALQSGQLSSAEQNALKDLQKRQKGRRTRAGIDMALGAAGALSGALSAVGSAVGGSVPGLAIAGHFVGGLTGLFKSGVDAYRLGRFRQPKEDEDYRTAKTLLGMHENHPKLLPETLGIRDFRKKAEDNGDMDYEDKLQEIIKKLRKR